MKYKIYRLIEIGENQGNIMQIIEDDEFKYLEYDSMEEAYDALKNNGTDYCNYTILPYIYMS